MNQLAVKKAFFGLHFFLFFGGLFAQKTEPKMTCEVSQTEVLLGNYVRVEYKVSGSQNGKWTMPEWNGFHVVSGPSQSTNFSMMNGLSEVSSKLTFLVEPPQVGDWVIPTASFALENGDILTAGDVAIQVFENPDGIIEKPETKQEGEFLRPFGGGLFDLFGQPGQPEDRLPEPSVKPKKQRKTVRI